MLIIVTCNEYSEKKLIFHATQANHTYLQVQQVMQEAK